MMKYLRMLKIALVLCGIVPFAGCVSLMETAGQTLDGSAEKKLSVYRSADMEVCEVQNKAGERSFFIAFNRYPAIKIRGSSPDSRGEFNLTSLDYLGGNYNGWNEYRLDLFGAGYLALGETTARLSIPGEIEMVHIASGRIRRYDTRITGSEALTSLRNRRERIIALTEWFASRDISPPAKDQQAFEAYWKPVLFPELTAQKERPAQWQQEGDVFVQAEDIRWNTGYTERVFPQELWVIRNSGTLLRDWEEAVDWIYIEYEWGRITELLAQETVLTKTKK